MMPTRLRKLVGGVGMLAFLFFYVGVMVAIADHLPDQWAVKLVFFVLAGTLWGVPLLPLITWMNKEP
jgi:hypothetical protein